jgi:hypothetical protein
MVSMSGLDLSFFKNPPVEAPKLAPKDAPLIEAIRKQREKDGF